MAGRSVSSTRGNAMSVIACDYRAEARAAAQIAEAATSEIDRSDWMFLALAWQALARSRDPGLDRPSPAAAKNPSRRRAGRRRQPR